MFISANNCRSFMRRWRKYVISQSKRACSAITVYYCTCVLSCGWHHSISGSSDCLPLLGNMSMEIGPVNIYDIYTKCSINMGNKITWRALWVIGWLVRQKLSSSFFLRNPLQTLLETIQDLEQPPPPPPPRPAPPSGPLGCIDDHIERLYFDNEKVIAYTAQV